MQLEIELNMFMMSEQAISRNIHPYDMFSTQSTCTQQGYEIDLMKYVQRRNIVGKSVVASQTCNVSNSTSQLSFTSGVQESCISLFRV